MNSRIKICHVQVLPLMSGTQRSMLELFRFLDHDKYELHVACRGAGELTEELDRLGIRWHAIAAIGRPLHPLHDFRAYRQLRTLFAREQFALVHTHSSKPGFLGRVAARRAGVACIVHHVRGFSFHEFTPRHVTWFYKQLEWFAAKFCDKILFVNHEERLMAVEEKLVKPDQAATIYNGANLHRFSPPETVAAEQARCDLNGSSSRETVNILFSGRLEPQKQPLILADIARELLRRNCTRPWQLLVAGDGPMEAALRQRCEQLGVTSHVRFLGWQPSPEKAYGAADVMLLPSLYEGLSRSLIEAHAMGLPCVASNVKGNREVIVPETGFLCSPTQAHDYAACLARLVESEDRRRQMGIAARRRAEQSFDTVANNREIVRVYEQLLAERGLFDRAIIEPADITPRRAA